MKVESNQNNNSATNSANTLSFLQLKDYLASADYNSIVEKHSNDFLTQANAALSDLQTKADALPEGAVKTSLESAIGALNQKKELLATTFKDVTTYSVFGVWQMADSSMNNIQSTQDCQNKMMNLDEMVEQEAQTQANYYANTVLAADISKINGIVTAPDSSDPQVINSEITAATTLFNQHNTSMSALSTFFSGINSSINNVITSCPQSISIDLSNLQNGRQKIYDTIAQCMQPQ